jgi:hypothetical protein
MSDPSITTYAEVLAKYMGIAAETAKRQEEEKAAEVSGIRIQSAAEFAGTLTPREWIVKDWWPKGAELCVIFGPPGSGKSFFLDDIVTDVHLSGHRVTRIVAEGANDDRFRRHALAKHKGVALDKLPRVLNDAPDLFNAEEALRIAKLVKADGGCDVLVIDVLSATFSGDENGSDMGRYIRHVKLIQRALKCTVWIIHHSGKSVERGARGWSGLKAAADVELEVERDERSDERTVTVRKAKGGRDGQRMGFALKVVSLGRDADGDDYGSCVVVHQGAPAAKVGDVRKEQPSGKWQVAAMKLLRHLAPHGTIDRDELAAAVVLKVTGAKLASAQDKRSITDAFRGLASKGLLHWHNTDRLSLTALVTGEDEAWLN